MAAVDVGIVGGGITGLAAALALAGATGARPRLAVCDPRLDAGAARPRSLRAIAIAPASRAFLQGLGVWSAVADNAQPLTRMRLGDTRPGEVPAPAYLTFDGREETNDAPLAHMVFQDDLHAALLEACRRKGIALHAAAVTRAVPVPGALALAEAGLRARLVVAADGGRSRLRESAGIGVVARDYAQAGIVATLRHSRDHQGEAIQNFLPAGPLAFLPLRAPDGTRTWSSIVWTVDAADAPHLLALPADAFCAQLEQRGGFERGSLTLVDRPCAHPLAVRLARRLTGERLVLAGDAARTVHPLAGQGLNLGLGDAAALARVVGDALALGLDPGAPRVGDAYGRARHRDQLAVAAATHGLNRLFSNNNGALRLLRDLGLGLVDRAPALKRALIRQASGAP